MNEDVELYLLFKITLTHISFIGFKDLEMLVYNCFKTDICYSITVIGNYIE